MHFPEEQFGRGETDRRLGEKRKVKIRTKVEREHRMDLY